MVIKQLRLIHLIPAELTSAPSQISTKDTYHQPSVQIFNDGDQNDPEVLLYPLVTCFIIISIHEDEIPLSTGRHPPIFNVPPYR
jgi:hypothetical protein